MRVFTVYPEKDTMSIDSMQAFLALGHDVFEYVLKIDPETKTFEYDLVDIIKNVIEWKPDFIFSLNVVSLDYLGVVARALHILKIPAFVWFIDNPFYYANKFFFLSALPNMMVSVWDTFYIDPMKHYFSEIYHLPQCTNPDRFKEISLDENDLKKFSANLSFAANLDSKKMEVFCAEVVSLFPNVSADTVTVVTLQAIEYALKNRDIATPAILNTILEKNNYAINDEWCKRLLERMIEFGVSAYERKHFVTALIPYGIKVWGDGEWRRYITEDVFCGWSNYFSETVKLFRASKINLNLSRMQQRYSTNQRVFDVPAAKAFLISDFKKEMADYFEIGKEMICFTGLDDLKDKISFFIDRPKERQAIIERGYEKVITAHTYQNRMKQVVTWVNEKKLIVNEEKLIAKEYAPAYFSLGQASEKLKDLPQAVQYYRKTVLSDKSYAKNVEKRLEQLGC